MAATEYFGTGARPPLQPQSSSPYPSPHSQQPQPQGFNSSQPAFGYPSPQPGYPSPQFNGVQGNSPYLNPPPYQPLNGDPKVHFQSSQPPTPGAHRPSLSSQPTYALNQPNFQASQGQQLSPYPPGPYVPRHSSYSQPSAYPPTHRSHHRSSLSEEITRSGYTSDPEHHRRSHKNRPRRVSDNSRSTATDGLIGAAGGGLIGDLIFPGLGTVGGALVGWLGGKDYGKHRKWREDKRDRKQEAWEKKYHKDDHGSDTRSRSHSHDDRADRDWDVRDKDKDSQWSRRHSHDSRDGRSSSHARHKSYD